MTSTTAETGPATLEFRGFGWRPGTRASPVVRDLSLRIAPGERVLLTGPSGAGKSTLLQAAAGVLGAVDDGEVTGSVLVSGADAARREQPVGMLFQRPADGIVADRVGRDVAFGPENLSLPRAEIWARAREALQLVGFPYGTDTPTQSLSGGEQQRLALAGALAMRPALLLLDEPTALLDADAAAAVRAAVREVVALTGATLVVVEHQLAPWLDHVDRMLVLGADGTLLCDDQPAPALVRHSAQLADAGVWLPGLGAPSPLTVPPVDVVTPSGGDLPRGVPFVAANALTVRLRSRGLRQSRELVALSEVDAGVVGGAITTVTGPSGAGKSTLLGALGGLIPPSRGQVVAAPTFAVGPELRPHRWASPELAARVGWVPQDPEHGFLTNRVIDEVRLTAQRLGRAADAERWLQLLSLERLSEANPYRLSGGEQRRLGLIAALAHRPPIALLDEPSIGQDRHTWSAVAGLLRGFAAGGCAVAVATHDRALVESIGDVERPLSHGRVGEPR